MTEEEIKLHKEKRRITTSFIFGIPSIILFILFPIALVFAIVGITSSDTTSSEGGASTSTPNYGGKDAGTTDNGGKESGTTESNGAKTSDGNVILAVITTVIALGIVGVVVIVNRKRIFGANN